VTKCPDVQVELEKKKMHALNNPNFKNKKLNDDDEIEKHENSDDDEDLRRFLRGGFGAK
jgi:hypothetical protein